MSVTVVATGFGVERRREEEPPRGATPLDSQSDFSEGEIDIPSFLNNPEQ